MMPFHKVSPRGLAQRFAWFFGLRYQAPLQPGILTLKLLW